MKEPDVTETTDAGPPLDRDALAAVLADLAEKATLLRYEGERGDVDSAGAASQRGRAAGIRDALTALAPLLHVVSVETEVLP